MAKRYFFLVFILFSLIFSGCGGGGGSASQSSSGGGAPSAGTLNSGGGPTGRIELSIEWPEVSKGGKLIPQATDRVEVWVSGEGLQQPLFQSIPRSQMQNNQAVISFPSVPVGSKTVEVKAFDSGGALVAHRIKPVSVTAGQQTQVAAPLGMTVFDGRFVPFQFLLNKGETVLLVNGGLLNHSVETSNGDPISGVLSPGAFFPFQPDSPGITDFRCGIHHEETGKLIVQYPPPVITGLSSPNGPPGSSLTITGNNFGGSQNGSQVTIGGIPAQVATWSDTQIVCTVSGGSGSWNVIVTVENVPSIGWAFAVDPYLAKNQNSPVGMTVIGNEVFWIENIAGGHVRKVLIAGGPVVTLTPSGGLSVQGPTSDDRGLTSSGNTLFWIDKPGADFVINKVNRDETGFGTLATFPSGTSQSTTWLSADGVRVYASGGNGANRALVSAKISDGTMIYANRTDASGPEAVSMEHDGNFLLVSFADSPGNYIARADKSDANIFSTAPSSALSPKIWQSMMYNVRHLVADNTYVYWVESADSSFSPNTGRVRRCDRSPLANVTDMVTGLSSPTRLRVDTDSTGVANRLYWVDDNGLHRINGASGAGPWTPINGLGGPLAANVKGEDLIFVKGDPISGRPDLILWTASNGYVFRLEQ